MAARFYLGRNKVADRNQLPPSCLFEHAQKIKPRPHRAYDRGATSPRLIFVIISILALIKGWGIKHRFSEPLMADSIHSFCFSLLCF